MKMQFCVFDDPIIPFIGKAEIIQTIRFGDPADSEHEPNNYMIIIVYNCMTLNAT